MGTDANAIRTLTRRLRWVALLICGSLCLAACGHGSVDSANVLRQLKVVLRAVPDGATNVRTTATGATWNQGCVDGTGHAGWTSVYVTASFTAMTPESSVLERIGGMLARHGWTRDDTKAVGRQGPIPHWTKVVNGNPLANAFAYPDPAGSDTWFVTAAWQPSPEVDYGDCA